MISGRRSVIFGCGCFSVFIGDNTTVQANISSVDNSMGCEGVLSSGVYTYFIWILNEIKEQNNMKEKKESNG